MIFFFLILFFLFQPVVAQYGFNHPELEWKSIETPHFKVHFHNGAEWTARKVAGIAETIYKPVTDLYDYTPPEKTHLIIKDFNDYSNGAAYYYDNKIEIWSTPLDYLLRGSHPWLLDVVTHEFTHIISLGASMKFTHNIPTFYVQWIGYEKERRKDVITGYPNQIISYPIPGVVIPPWLAEGMAQYMYPGAEGDFWDSHRDMILRDKVLNGTLLSFEEMNSFGKTGIGNESVYNQGYALVRYLSETYGQDSLKKLAGELQKKSQFSINNAMRKVFGRSGEQIYQDWTGSLESRYDFISSRIKGNESDQRLLVKEGTTSIFPSWIEDKAFYFLSNKGMDYFSVTSLYRYDLESGEMKRIIPGVTSKVTQSQDGKVIYYSKKSNPDRQGSVYLDIFRYDVREHEEKQITHFRRAYQPALSPDGKQLVFVHGEDGTHNLILYNPEDNSERQLTMMPEGTQIFSPEWSHDGKMIVFDYMTDKHGRDLAILEVESGKMRVIDDRPYDTRDAIFGNNDEWLYYSSDETGIYNIYRRKLKTRKIEQLTNVVGGAFMPAVNEKGQLLFSLYENGGYRIALLDSIKEISDTAPVHSADSPVKVPEVSQIEPNYGENTQPYEFQFARMFIMPKLMVDYRTLKPGFYFYSNEVLDKMSVFGGASINKLMDKDLFMIFDYKRFKYTLSFEIYHISRRVDQSLAVYQAYPSDNEYNFSLFELDEKILIPLTMNHFLNLRFSQQKYRAKIRQTIEGIRYPTIAYDYYRGFLTSLSWEYRKMIPSFASESNPRFGLKITTQVTGELNRFISELDFSKYSTLVPTYTPYDLIRLEQEGAWYTPLPFVSSGAFNFEWRWGWINKTSIESFFNFFAGGLPGLRGYPYYSLEGRNLVLTRTSFRIPVFTQRSVRILPFSLQNMFIGAYIDWGNAWDKTNYWKEIGMNQGLKSNLNSMAGMLNSVFGDFKKDVGLQFRFSGFSFYNYPTAISLDAVYGIDRITVVEEQRTLEYGREWRTYLTVLFGL